MSKPCHQQRDDLLNSLASDWQADTVGAGGDTTTGGGGV
ncbi:hypothetical protein Tco_0643088, partial [Tanacetum coccineum]